MAWHAGSTGWHERVWPNVHMHHPEGLNLGLFVSVRVSVVESNFRPPPPTPRQTHDLMLSVHFGQEGECKNRLLTHSRLSMQLSVSVSFWWKATRLYITMSNTDDPLRTCLQTAYQHHQSQLSISDMFSLMVFLQKPLQCWKPNPVWR